MILTAKEIEIDTLSKAIPNQLHHAHCSAIVTSASNEILVGWYHAIKEAERNQQIYFTRKELNSSIWTQPDPIAKTDNLRFDGNPILWMAPDTNKLWLIYNVGFGWSVCWIKYRISDDFGRSWSKPKNLYPFISRGVKNPPIYTSKGWYVLPAYVEFKFLRAVFFISKDQGKTWKQSNKVDLSPELIARGYEHKKGRQVEQPTVIERKDGSLMALCRNDGQPMKKMLITESFDGGFTWTPARNYLLPNPAGGFHMIRLKSGAIAIIYNHAPTPDNDRKWRNPLSVAISMDEGKSWQYRRNILEWHPDNANDEENNCTFQYPTLTQDERGIIHATWSLSHPEIINNRSFRFTDIQYTSFTEDWIKRTPYFENAWELKKE
jgi:predicted neuraminidase